MGPMGIAKQSRYHLFSYEYKCKRPFKRVLRGGLLKINLQLSPCRNYSYKHELWDQNLDFSASFLQTL